MDWQTIWLLLGGNAAATAALGFLFKLWFQHGFDMKLARFTKDMEEKNAAKLEILRLSLGKELHAFTARNSILAQKQAEVIGELFTRICDIQGAVSQVGNLNDKVMYEKVMLVVKEHWFDCRDFFRKNAIFVDRELSAKITAMLSLLLEQSLTYGDTLRMIPEGQAFVMHIENVGELNRPRQIFSVNL